MLAGLLALTIAAVFAGAAIYVSAVEQVARLPLDDRALLTEWKPSYKRGAAMQASLAATGTILGLISWWETRSAYALAGAAAILAPWPWTLIVIKPTVDTLLATDPAAANAGTRTLIEKWGHLHLVRAALGVLATILFVAAAAATR